MPLLLQNDFSDDWICFDVVTLEWRLWPSRSSKSSTNRRVSGSAGTMDPRPNEVWKSDHRNKVHCLVKYSVAPHKQIGTLHGSLSVYECVPILQLYFLKVHTDQQLLLPMKSWWLTTEFICASLLCGMWLWPLACHICIVILICVFQSALTHQDWAAVLG